MSIISYGFYSIHEYFDYIIESRTNGQHKQAKSLFKDLTDDDGMLHLGQKTMFFRYMEDIGFNDESIEEYKEYFNQ
jgi:hypothetical protein